MRCSECGFENEDQAKFCVKCGAQLRYDGCEASHEEASKDSEYDQYFELSEDMDPGDINAANRELLFDNSKIKRAAAIIIAALIVVIAAAAAVGGRNMYKADQWQKYYDSGQKYLSEQNYDKAVAAFTNAINIDKKNSLAYIGRGDAYADQAEKASDPDEAIELYKKASGDYGIAKDSGEKSAAAKYDDSKVKIMQAESSSRTERVLNTYSDIDIPDVNMPDKDKAEDTGTGSDNAGASKIKNNVRQSSVSASSDSVGTSDKVTSNKKSNASSTQKPAASAGNSNAQSKKPAQSSSKNTQISTDAANKADKGNTSVSGSNDSDNSYSYVATPSDLVYVTPSDLVRYE